MMRLVFTLALVCLSATIAAAADRPPNIVFILADDLGYAELGCYGQEKIRTPRIDRMAAEGMRFTQHYSGCAVCAPSRCALMTGRHMGHAYIRNNSEVKPEGQKPIADSVVTIGEILQAAGYACGAMGKWGLGGPDSVGHPNRQGFDLFYGYLCQRHAHNHFPIYLWRNERRVELAGNTRGLTGEHFSGDLFTDVALEFIRANQDRPFFLYVPYAVPHLAIQVPEDSLAEYRGQWDDSAYEGGKGYLPHPAPRAGYAAMVTRMDRDVGRILDLIAELGLDENTLVIFSSDNGPTYDRLGGSDSDFFTSTGPFRGLKGSLHEGGIRVPCVARWPGKIAAGTIRDHISAFWDFVPTACEVAGVDAEVEFDGVSYLPTLLDEPQPEHEFLYWEFAAYGGQQAVRSGRYKAIRQNMRQGNLEIELYDLATDPGETTDLADRELAVLERLTTIMQREHAPSELFPLPGVDFTP